MIRNKSMTDFGQCHEKIKVQGEIKIISFSWHSFLALCETLHQPDKDVLANAHICVYTYMSYMHT